MSNLLRESFNFSTGLLC